MSTQDVIHVYNRAQAIADGVLVDVTETAKEAGYRFSVALTRTVWSSCVEVPHGVEGQDKAGRLWDILIMLRYAVRRSKADSVILFQLHVRNDNRHEIPPLVELKAVCAPNDDGTACITIMEPFED